MKKEVLNYTLASVENEANEKLEARFHDESGQLFQIVFKGTASLRIHGEQLHRLFFPEIISGQKTRFLNEYGMEAGKVTSKIYEGTISTEQQMCRFRLTGEDPRLEIVDHLLGEVLLTVEVNDELLVSHADIWSQEYLLHGVCFSFAWSLFRKN